MLGMNNLKGTIYKDYRHSRGYDAFSLCYSTASLWCESEEDTEAVHEWSRDAVCAHAYMLRWMSYGASRSQRLFAMKAMCLYYTHTVIQRFVSEWILMKAESRVLLCPMFHFVYFLWCGRIRLLQTCCLWYSDDAAKSIFQGEMHITKCCLSQQGEGSRGQIDTF